LKSIVYQLCLVTIFGRRTSARSNANWYTVEMSVDVVVDISDTVRLLFVQPMAASSTSELTEAVAADLSGTPLARPISVLFERGLVVFYFTLAYELHEHCRWVGSPAVLKS
jgi:hypothetical protein